MSNLVGIDLGTTYSAIAHLDATGRPVMLVNSQGDNTTPSVVLFDDQGNVIVGKIAQGVYGEDSNCFGRFKRVMGEEKEYEAFGEKYNATSLSSFVLKKLKDDAHTQIGEISEAVVTIPANYSNKAREATLAAANASGLSIKYIINEPTAAALYYAYSSGEELNGTYAIYDLGGGTFDISIIQIKGSDIEVINTDGVTLLGGDDFDEKLIEIVRSKWKDQVGEDLEPEDFTKNDAEEQKKILSEKEKTSIKIATTKGRHKIEISRAEFEDAISTLIAKSEMTCENAIDEANLSITDINEVILVGGSTRMPCIQSSVEKIFKKVPKSVGNPDEAVALGAALYVAYKADPAKLNPLQKQALSKVNIAEVTAKFFGTIILSYDDHHQKNLLKNDSLISKGDKIPCSVTKEYQTAHDNQTAINCRVTESNIEESDPDYVHTMWEGALDLPEGRPSGQKVEVTFSYDVNQTMKCTFLDVESGRKAEIDLTADNSNIHTDIDIDDFKVE